MYKIVGQTRYGYNGTTYRPGDLIEISDDDLGGFDSRDIELVEPVAPPEQEPAPKKPPAKKKQSTEKRLPPQVTMSVKKGKNDG